MLQRPISRFAPIGRLAAACLPGVLAFGCSRSSDSPALDGAADDAAEQIVNELGEG